MLNITDTPSVGELGVAGTVGASATASGSKVEEVEKSDVWMKKCKGKRWEEVGLEVGHAKGVKDKEINRKESKHEEGGR
jgi:hypothetical protein